MLVASRINTYYSWGVAGHLVETRLIQAAHRWLQAFPVLGAGVDLSSAASLRLQDARFPLSFAEWPSSSSDKLFGLRAASPLPTLPVYDAIKVAGLYEHMHLLPENAVTPRIGSC